MVSGRYHDGIGDHLDSDITPELVPPTTATTVDASTKMKDPVLATIGLELVPHG